MSLVLSLFVVFPLASAPFLCELRRLGRTEGDASSDFIGIATKRELGSLDTPQTRSPANDEEEKFNQRVVPRLPASVLFLPPRSSHT